MELDNVSEADQAGTSHSNRKYGNGNSDNGRGNSPRQQSEPHVSPEPAPGQPSVTTVLGDRAADAQPQLDKAQLLEALLAFKRGNFSVRLPVDLEGVDGKIADVFNDVMGLSDRMAAELQRLSRTVGKEGKISQRANVGDVTGAWAEKVDAVNTLISDLVHPIGETSRVIGAVVKGDLSQTIALEIEGRPLAGEFATASVAINAALSIDGILQTITDAARNVIGAHQAITVLIDPRAGKTQRRTRACASYSEKYASWRSRPLDLELVASSIVARSRSATRMTEAELQEHPDWDIVRRLDIPPIHGGVLAAPLSSRDDTNLGVIYLTDGDEGAFSADDEAILLQLTQMASVAIENTIFAEEREANRLKDEFLSTLSHELRTPLNAISGWVQLLRMQPLDEQVSHGLEVVERNVQAQTNLIDELLDLSRITTGKFRLNMRPVPLKPVAAAAVDAMRPLVEDRKISLTYDAGPAEPVVYGDPDRLQQVFWNLLSNAAKFTPADGRIDVQLRHENGSVQLIVADSGAGIERDFLPHVFDRFKQADSSSSRRHGGLGIGLTIVRHIVELHGGTVAADSAGKDRGSTFTIRLPSPAALQHALQPSIASDDHSPRRCSLQGVRVLLVDDEADTREVVGEILRRGDAEVVTAASAGEAMSLLGQFKPDVLVSDIAMPEQDGFALMREVRRLPFDKGGGIPAVALTAYARPEDQALAFAAGFQYHVAKPIDPDELVGAVNRCRNKPALVSPPTTMESQPGGAVGAVA